MNRQLQTAFDKLQRKQTKLSKEVKLAAIDVIYDNLDAFEEAEMDALYLANELGDELIGKIEQYRSDIGQIDDFVINGQVTSLPEYAENILNAIYEIEDKTSELGIDPNEVIDVPSNYSDLDDLKGRVIAAADSLYNEAEAKYKEVVEYSGFLADFWR